MRTSNTSPANWLSSHTSPNPTGIQKNAANPARGPAHFVVCEIPMAYELIFTKQIVSGVQVATACGIGRGSMLASNHIHLYQQFDSLE
jgi:hypothetical protein